VRRERGESYCDQDQCAVSAVRQLLIDTMTVEVDPGPPRLGVQGRVRAPDGQDPLPKSAKRFAALDTESSARRGRQAGHRSLI
jgi:hypothetical protein